MVVALEGAGSGGSRGSTVLEIVDASVKMMRRSLRVRDEDMMLRVKET